MGILSSLLFPRRVDKYTKVVPGSLRVGDIEITRLEALGGSQPGITKVGRLSLSGYIGEQKVKAYTAHSEKHAELLRHLHSLEFESCQLSPLLAIEGRLVVEAWVAGDSVASLKGEERQKAVAQVSRFLVELAEKFSGSQNTAGSMEGFCYLENYLLARLSEWRHHHEIGQFLGAWLEDYRALQPMLTPRISHPDLSSRNLILEKGTGLIRIIDNELLGFGHGWLLDWRNSLLSKAEFLTPNTEAGIPQPFVEKTWLLRELGSALDAGRFDKVQGLLANA